MAWRLQSTAWRSHSFYRTVTSSCPPSGDRFPTRSGWGSKAFRTAWVRGFRDKEQKARAQSLWFPLTQAFGGSCRAQTSRFSGDPGTLPGRGAQRPEGGVPEPGSRPPAHTARCPLAAHARSPRIPQAAPAGTSATQWGSEPRSSAWDSEAAGEGKRPQRQPHTGSCLEEAWGPSSQPESPAELNAHAGEGHRQTSSNPAGSQMGTVLLESRRPCLKPSTEQGSRSNLGGECWGGLGRVGRAWEGWGGWGGPGRAGKGWGWGGQMLCG